jgi:uncharacterized glyoxalase superfamily protein PhnB
MGYRVQGAEDRLHKKVQASLAKPGLKMTTRMHNRSIPDCTVIPELPCRDIEQMTSWYTRAFGFTLRIGIGAHRAQLNVNDGAVVLIERGTNMATCSVMVRVQDAQAHHDRAKVASAEIVRAPEDHPYGERQYTAVDPEGHRWNFSQSIADVAPQDWGGTAGELRTASGALK